MNAQDYTIVVQKTDIESERLFEITVVEFPDVVVYDEDLQEAYSIAIDTITGLIEMAAEMGHQIPIPLDNSDKEFSGKITFRPGRKLHLEISKAAERDGVSLNQWLCFAASTSTTSGAALTAIRDEIRTALAHVSPTYVPLVSDSVAKRSTHGSAFSLHLENYGEPLFSHVCEDDNEHQQLGFSSATVSGTIVPVLTPLLRKQSASR